MESLSVGRPRHGAATGPRTATERRTGNRGPQHAEESARRLFCRAVCPRWIHGRRAVRAVPRSSSSQLTPGYGREDGDPARRVAPRGLDPAAWHRNHVVFALTFERPPLGCGPIGAPLCGVRRRQCQRPRCPQLPLEQRQRGPAPALGTTGASTCHESKPPGTSWCPFSRRWRGPAHAFVSFGFDDGQYLAISVEARREQGEQLRGYSRDCSADSNCSTWLATNAT